MQFVARTIFWSVLIYLVKTRSARFRADGRELLGAVRWFHFVCEFQGVIIPITDFHVREQSVHVLLEVHYVVVGDHIAILVEFHVVFLHCHE